MDFPFDLEESFDLTKALFSCSQQCIIVSNYEIETGLLVAINTTHFVVSVPL